MTTFAAHPCRPRGAHAPEAGRRRGRRALHVRGTRGAVVANAAAFLRRAGVSHDDVVSSQLPNGVDALVVAFAANRLGAVHNPITTIAGARELDFILDQADSRPFIDGPGHALFTNARHGDTTPIASPTARDVPRILVYTSGSTAQPKGVLHSDATLLAECAAQTEYHGLRADEVFVMPSPVAHVSGLIYGVLLPIYLGATSVLLARWDATAFLAAIERERGTFSGGATPFLEGLVDHPDLERFDLRSFRRFPCGGADVPPDLIRRARARLGILTGRGFGSTEFPSITSSAGPDEPEDRRAETEGRPIGENRVRVTVDGEIEAIGPELCLGYLDSALDPDAFTADGWLRTGDLGTIDADGALTFTGRAKDVIIRLGEKVPAKDVEQLVVEHPAIVDAAVIAIPDVYKGERVCVVHRRRSHAPLTDTRRTRRVPSPCRGLAARRLPEQIEIVDALPRTPGGKVDKRTLRERFSPS